MVIDLA
jgi:hypothetical protein